MDHLIGLGKNKTKRASSILVLNSKKKTSLPRGDPPKDIHELFRRLRTSIVTKDRKVFLKTYRDTFFAADAVEWFLNNVQEVKSIQDAEDLGLRMQSLGLLVPINVNKKFRNKFTLFQFNNPNMEKKLSSMSSSVAALRSAEVECVDDKVVSRYSQDRAVLSRREAIRNTI
mmetsp:Transcript_1876/g.4292  ORF Transcript_1876/g.4292 Transcript_1876/m.4292 type:complete len:171 (-) Transcript_1876:19-531(-)